MPLLDSNVIIIGINNHAFRGMDNDRNNFSDLKKMKSGTLTKKVAKELEMKAHGIFYWNTKHFGSGALCGN